MKFAFVTKSAKDIVEYTITVLRCIAVAKGHTITRMQECDVIGVSVCDVSEIKFLKKIRDMYPHKKILVGGHASVYFKLFLIYADAVNVGHAFEALSCASWDEIVSLPCVATGAKETITSSNFIEWRLFPLANVTKKQQYYVGGFGCKNKCKFCLTSWTHQHTTNPFAENVLRRQKTVTIVSNDSHHIQDRMTQSMMVKDFVRKKILKKYAVYRLGVEFATERSRSKYGKPFSDKEFLAIFTQYLKWGARLKLFCIAGINTHDEWHRLFSMIPSIYQKETIEIKFTNLNYEMFAPIKKERYSLDPSLFFTTDKAREFITVHKERVWPLKSMPTMKPIDTLFKTSLCWVTNADELQHLSEIKKSLDDVCDNLLCNLFKNDYSGQVLFK